MARIFVSRRFGNIFLEWERGVAFQLPEGV